MDSTMNSLGGRGRRTEKFTISEHSPEDSMQEVTCQEPAAETLPLLLL